MDLLIGGIIPAILLGLGTILVRLSLGGGISIATYLLTVGSTITVVGTIAVAHNGLVVGGNKAISSAIVMGLTWAGAISCISYGFSVLRLPVSVVAPLTNCNALIAVLLGSVLFSEWQSLQMPKVVIGTLLIGIGATLVSTAK